MTKFLKTSDTSGIEDAREIHHGASISKSRLSRKLVAVTLALLSIVLAIHWMYFYQVLPARDAARVDEAMSILAKEPKGTEWLSTREGLPEERRLIELASFLRSKESGVPPEVGLSASRAALNLAIHRGSSEAKLVLGKALRDGHFGEKDPNGALALFHNAFDDLQAGIKSSDEDALYVYALMLKDGLGVEVDTKKSAEIVKRVALSRDTLTMSKIAWSSMKGSLEERDFDLTKAISRKLIEKGRPASFIWATIACYEQFKATAEENALGKALFASENWKALGEWGNRATVRSQLRDECKLPFLRLAAEKGEKAAIEALLEIEPRATTKFEPPDKSWESYTPEVGADLQTKRIKQRVTDKPVDRFEPVATVDAEAQDKTGYLHGVQQLAKGGLSSFKVDNSKGGGDAVVRLYLGGKKPAVRSIFVKNGESFTAEAISPGAYRMRYRFIGSDDTFEAEETFQLLEKPSENGTRFSRLTVTLFKVANGNMAVKKVEANEF